MPFKLINVGANFQGVMQMDFDDLIGIIIQIYLDDLTMYYKIREDHFEHLRQVCDVPHLLMKRFGETR